MTFYKMKYLFNGLLTLRYNLKAQYVDKKEKKLSRNGPLKQRMT